ncbi:MAG TPA: aldehyde dehydrogenase family protein [Spirochaetia bacterium]|nr:aldehyde dehydrogenase family protein [Spirochaetia bacterium]
MEDDVRKRVAGLFPRLQDVPAEADFAPGGERYEKGVQYLVEGELRTWGGRTREALSAVCTTDKAGGVTQRPLGLEARLDKEAALGALEAARAAWDNGRGRWPTMRVGDRVEALKLFVSRMRAVREETVRLLTWEIGKSRADSEKEFDRTVQYIVDTIEALKETDRAGARFSANDGVLAHIRRAPLGVVLCMGPFNYPLNETFTTLIPALAMGNTVVVKLPRYGALCQAPLLACFAESFPPGVVNIVNGDGREVAGPIVETGEIASLAFIGSSRAANDLRRRHPMPNRLRCILSLDAKNPAIVLEDADLDLAVAECVIGALSFNGQRCTALKLLFVHRAVAERFVGKLADAVDALPFGMPWEKGVRVTPLPALDRVAKMQALTEDARSRGAGVVNRWGGLTNATFYFPAVVYPVSPGMELYTVEQFGPVVPVAVFDDMQEVFEAVVASNYGQQASVFGTDPRRIGSLIDALANQVCRVNLNAQCQRGPDVYPFAGRKDSAEGTLSVSDALRCFSIRSMVAAPGTETNTGLLRDIVRERTSNFVNTDYLF